MSTNFEVYRDCMVEPFKVDVRGLKVLLVEDDLFLGMDMTDHLTQRGCTVYGPITNVASAMELIATDDFDFIILDVQMNGKSIEPIARALQDRGLPFVFYTGDRRNAETVDLDSEVPTFIKPMPIPDLIDKVCEALDVGEPGGSRSDVAVKTSFH